MINLTVKLGRFGLNKAVNKCPRGVDVRVIDEPKVMPKIRIFINGVGNYPVSAEELVERAEQAGESELAGFYRAFLPDTVFPDKEDLLARSEQVGLLNSEIQPVEELHASEED